MNALNAPFLLSALEPLDVGLTSLGEGKESLMIAIHKIVPRGA